MNGEDTIRGFSLRLLSEEEMPLVNSLIAYEFAMENPGFSAPDYVLKRLHGKNNTLIFSAINLNGEYAGVIIGYEQTPDIYYLWRIAVSPVHRRRGIGKALVSSAMKKALDLGYASLTCKTWNSSREMMHLLIAAGFDIIGTEFYASQKDIAVIWENKLSQNTSKLL
jgi:ribosomal protein S18 acetylase RimI-like enzyme